VNPWLPIDAHAHVETGIAELELRALHAFVFAVTREPAEWKSASERRDRECVWGLGCHPKLPRALDQFDAEKLHELVEHQPLIGEVGLDGKSPVHMNRQRQVFRAVLDVARTHRRLVTIHSSGASEEVLTELEERPIAGAILHWWRGDETQTRRAVELGCFFSLNGAEAKRPKVLAHLPPERVLTETDFPHSTRSDPKATTPGAVQTIETALAQCWRQQSHDVRRQVWSNLGALCERTRTAGLFPRAAQAALIAVGN
jgi:TatD DNase family protein